MLRGEEMKWRLSSLDTQPCVGLGDLQYRWYTGRGTYGDGRGKNGCWMRWSDILFSDYGVGKKAFLLYP
jgi:hypothetical protein